MTRPTKSPRLHHIPALYRVTQAGVLTGILSPLLALLCVHALTAGGTRQRPVAMSIVSLTFALAVWLLRAATASAAACGAMICLLLGLQSGVRSGLLPLATLFLLTFAATKAGIARKALLGVAESRRGRSASQILANLGVAGLCAGHPVLVAAALAEATADTLASEIGQAFGGTPVLIGTLRRVPAGTDGAVSLLGTAAGLVSAAAIVLATGLDLRRAFIAFAGATAGFLADTLLGATAERRGWLGNDWVNFASTAVAVLVAWAASAL